MARAHLFRPVTDETSRMLHRAQVTSARTTVPLR